MDLNPLVKNKAKTNKQIKTLDASFQFALLPVFGISVKTFITLLVALDQNHEVIFFSFSSFFQIHPIISPVNSILIRKETGLDFPIRRMFL